MSASQDSARAGAGPSPVSSAGSARERVLGRVKTALGREHSEASADNLPDDVVQRLANHRRHTLPALGEDLVQRAIEQMEGVLISVVRLQSSDDVVEAVRFWRESEGIEGGLSVSPALSNLNWPEGTHSGPATGIETTSVTPCAAAVAETGSLALVSSADTPATLNFLPENHAVVLYENQIVPHVDDVFPLLRQLSPMPRALNFVTGPSRTGDIEQTIEIGAHGPRRMHVLLLPGDAPA